MNAAKSAILNAIGECRSAAMRQLHELAVIVGPSTSRVLVTGEAGVGKELLARYLHGRSTRSREPFVTLDCAAEPAAAASELFGKPDRALEGCAVNPEILVALVGVFAAFGTASGLIVSRVLAGHAIERKRLRQWIGRPEGAAISPELLVDRPITAAERLSRWLPVSPRKARKLGSRLAALGYPGPSAVVLFTALEVLLTVVLGLGTLVTSVISSGVWLRSSFRWCSSSFLRSSSSRWGPPSCSSRVCLRATSDLGSNNCG